MTDAERSLSLADILWLMEQVRGRMFAEDVGKFIAEAMEPKQLVVSNRDLDAVTAHRDALVKQRNDLLRENASLRKRLKEKK